MPDDYRSARQARRAARARRIRIRRLVVAGTAIAVVAAAGVVILRPGGSPDPAIAPAAADATSTPGASQSSAAASSKAASTPAAPAPAATKGRQGAADKPTREAAPAAAQPEPRPERTRASRDQSQAERPKKQARAALPAAKLPIISEGDYGSVIAAAQRALDVEPTGYFGPKTHRAVVEYQESIGLPTTGQVATFTWAALGAKTVRVALRAAATPDGFTEGEPSDLQETPSQRPANSGAAAGDPPVLEATDSGEAVAVVQRALGVKPATGYFGPKTDAAVRAFQSDNGLPTTGMIATYTWTALGSQVARAAARAHAEYGTAFGPGAEGSSTGGGGGGGNGGGGNGGSSGGNGGSSGSTPSARGLFCPVANFTYGDGLGAPRPGGRTHAGLDLMGSRGEPIYAIASGTVTRSGYQSNGGLILDITGSQGMFFYGHFDSIVVGYGDSVKAGQLIGYMGDTGSPGAVHLHLEVRPNGWSGGYNDPVPLIRSLCG
jgi:murein DD-endopeptidase MepM/ murein hydrolase activator NlpD